MDGGKGGGVLSNVDSDILVCRHPGETVGDIKIRCWPVMKARPTLLIGAAALLILQQTENPRGRTGAHVGPKPLHPSCSCVCMCEARPVFWPRTGVRFPTVFDCLLLSWLMFATLSPSTTTPKAGFLFTNDLKLSSSWTDVKQTETD